MFVAVNYDMCMKYTIRRGDIFVGCDCADRLTQSSSASTVEKLRKQKAKRFHTFQLREKWKHHKNGYFSIYKKFHIKIWFNAPIYIVQVEFSYLKKQEMWYGMS